MKAVLTGDIVSGSISAPGAPGPEIPHALRGLPLERLRFHNGALIDAATLSEFFIDDRGEKHVARAAGRVKITCKWDDVLVFENGKWRTVAARDRLAPAIKDECGRRIRAVMKDDVTQLNLLAEGLVLGRREKKNKQKTGDSDRLDALAAAHGWVRDMQKACRGLIAAEEENYSVDDNWPALPAGVAGLIAEF